MDSLRFDIQRFVSRKDGTSKADTLMNYSDNVVVYGYEGNDELLNAGDYVTLNGGAGADYIDNVGDNTKIYGDDGNDIIWNEGGFTTIYGGAGEDSIGNQTSYVTINGGADDDVINNGFYNDSIKGGSNVLINGGAGNDSILNFHGDNSTIYGDAGNDIITNGLYDIVSNSIQSVKGGNNVVIDGGSGNDTLANFTDRATMYGGNDSDYIANFNNYVVIDGGAGVDVIENYGDNVTIKGGLGIDRIELEGSKQVIQYAQGDGSDMIYGFSKNDTIQITSGVLTRASVSGSNVYLEVGSSALMLANAKDVSITVKDSAGTHTFKNSYTPSATINPFTSGNDYYSNETANVTLNALAGNDTVYNEGNSIEISGGAGDDQLTSFANSKNITLRGDAGNDTIHSWSSKSYIDGGDGDDSLYSSGTNSIVLGGKGNDTIKIFGDYTSISGDAGNDLITLTSVAFYKTINYSSGDGNDTIYGITSYDTISIGGESYTTAKSGSDIKINVGSGSILLKDAQNISLNIKGTLSGGNSLPIGLSVKNSIVTAAKTFTGSTIDLAYYPATKVNASALTTGISIIGSSAANSLKGGKGNDTIYGGSGNDTVSLGGGKDIYIYTGGNDLIQDYKAGDDKIKIASGSITGSSLSGSNVVLKTSNGNITVKSGKGKQITVIDSSGNETTNIYPLETVQTGISVKNSIVTAAKTFTGNKIDLADYDATKVNASALTTGISIIGSSAANSLKGGKGADTIYGGSGNDTVSLGGGKDIYIYSGGNDLIQDYKAGDDKIKLASGSITGSSLSGSNVVLKTSNGNITVKSGKGKNITVIDSTGNETTNIYPLETLQTGLSVKNSIVTAAKTFTGNKIDLADYAATKVNASALTTGISIIGSSAANSLKGGKGADTIYGGLGNDTVSLGGGKDIYIYSGGNDLIQDYKAGDDTIKLASDSISNTSYSGKNVIFAIGSGTLTVKNGKGKKISIIDSSGKTQTYSKTADLFYDDNFISDAPELSEITAPKYEVTQIQPQNESLAQEQPLITYGKEK